MQTGFAEAAFEVFEHFVFPHFPLRASCWTPAFCSALIQAIPSHSFKTSMRALVHDAEPITGEPCPVEDIEYNDDYLALPDKYELDLGTRLVWRFVGQEIPGLEPKVREIFSPKGAYRRWRDFLERNDLLDKY